MSKEDGKKEEKRKTPREILESIETENELDVRDPGTSGETIKQQKIKAFFEAKEALIVATNRYQRTYREVQGLVMAGAEIQPGRFGLKYGVKIVRRRSYKQDIINLKGETYQIKLLESAPKYAQFYVRVKPPRA